MMDGKATEHKRRLVESHLSRALWSKQAPAQSRAGSVANRPQAFAAFTCQLIGAADVFPRLEHVRLELSTRSSLSCLLDAAVFKVRCSYSKPLTCSQSAAVAKCDNQVL